MQRFVHRLGVVPVLILSIGLFLLGALAIDRVVNTLWLFDVTRIDLAGAVVQQRADAPTLLAAANGEILVAFLASIVVAFTGLAMVPCVPPTNRQKSSLLRIANLSILPLVSSPKKNALPSAPFMPSAARWMILWMKLKF